MKRALVLVVAIVLVGLSAAALEIRLRDGTVFEAASYTVTGSYLMVTLPSGRQVTYTRNAAGQITQVDLTDSAAGGSGQCAKSRSCQRCAMTQGAAGSGHGRWALSSRM